MLEAQSSFPTHSTHVLLSCLHTKPNLQSVDVSQLPLTLVNPTPAMRKTMMRRMRITTMTRATHFALSSILLYGVEFLFYFPLWDMFAFDLSYVVAKTY
jgi:hypothetical protein